MATQQLTSTPELERRRKRELRSAQKQTRREQEEAAIAASEQVVPDEDAPTEMFNESPDEVVPGDRSQRRPARARSDYDPFPESASASEEEIPATSPTQEEPQGNTDQSDQRRRSVSERIRDLRQAKNIAKSVGQAEQGVTTLREAAQVAKAAQNLASTGRVAGTLGRGAIALLNTPIGPLPLWAWILIVLGAIILLALIWLGVAVLAAAACEDQRIAWLPDAVKNAFAQLVVGLPCPGVGT